MKTLNTIAGNVYCVTSKNGGTLTDSTGTLNETVEAGKQVHITAPSDMLLIDDDEAIMRPANFKRARLALRMLGAGKNTLPAGYTRLDFLESTGTQHIDLRFKPNNESGIKCEHHTSRAENILLAGSRNGDSRWLAAIARGGAYTDGYGWNEWIFWDFVDGLRKAIGRVNFKNDRTASLSYSDGKVSTSQISGTIPQHAISAYLFAYNFDGVAAMHYKGKVFSAELTQGPDIVCSLIPVLDPTGEPCMFDLVSQQPYLNAGTGQFIAGVKNTAQLRTLLRKLPDRTGQAMGTLTLSIPAEANTPELQELLDTTETQKNWELTIQERPAEAATYSLRRVRKIVWVRRVPDKNGSYVDADGSRWQAEWCSAIYSPRGNDPTLHGYEPFDSVEQAAEAWCLTPYESPEELLTEA